MKKITCLLIITCILMSFISVNATENVYDDVQPQLLKTLGIIKNTDDFAQSLTQEITRAQFCTIAARLIKLPVDLPDNVNSPYIDVPTTHSAASSIYYLKEMGVFLNNSNDNFEPESHIMLTEALHIINGILGYGNYVDLNGGYPAGDLIVAKKNDILSGIYNTESNITIGDALKIALNALNAHSVNPIQSGKYTKYSSSDETILSEYFDTTMISGIVYADDSLSIKGNSALAENEIQIGNEIFRIKSTIKEHYIGQNVDAYYTSTDGNKTIIYLQPNEKNTVIKINDQDITYNDWTYRYIDSDQQNGKIKKAKITSDTDIIYNNKPLIRFDEELLVPKDGYVKLIDNNGNRNIDVLFIVSYNNYFISSTQEYDNGNGVYIFEDVSGNGVPALILSPDEKNGIEVINTEGKSFDCSKIKSNDVISVVGTYVDDVYVATEAFISRDSFEGVLEEKESTDYKTILTIDGQEYVVSENYRDIADTLAINAKMTFYLDYTGKIAGTVMTDVDGHSMSFAYLVDAKLTNNINHSIEFKMLRDNGKMSVIKGAKSITVDLKKFKNDPQGVYSLLLNEGGTAVKPQLICYRVNSEGEINGIDLASDTEITYNQNNSLQLLYNSGSTKLRRIASINSFGAKINYSDKTIFFCVPTNAVDADDEEFFTGYTSMLTNVPCSYQVAGYTINQNAVLADAIVIYDKYISEGYNYQLGVSMVKEVRSCLNQNGEITKKVMLLSTTGEIELVAKNEEVVTKAKSSVSSDTSTFSLDVGDIVQYQTDSSGEAISFSVIFDASENTFTRFDTIDSGFYNDVRVLNAKAYNISDGILQVVSKESIENDSITMQSTENHPISNSKIVVYDKNSKYNKVYYGSRINIDTYVNSGNNCSELLVHTQSGVPKTIFVIK